MKRNLRGSILIPSKVIWGDFQSYVTSLKWLCTISVPICPSILGSMSSGRLFGQPFQLDVFEVFKVVVP